ncbi:CDP-glycerol glycerophosphotransferase family protein [Methylophaga sp.]|uniref:CDP-glycerol glycerophosphotransferase family protein n=1 Tax=Methylophaga sp. TaxID=2024840 RepID=UPI0025EB138E|nr:CDP-glycerol glycerophosphotransferase family protein [Methylophaga sp.]
MKIEDFGIAFLVHFSEMFNHYAPVWNKLNREDFIIVVHGTEFERERTVEACEEYQVHYIMLEEVMAEGHRFPFMVSNHAMHQFNGRPLIETIAEKNIRFMYALGKARHNFSAWNSSYDLFLGFGPFHAEQLARFNTPVVQMGYPRYDIFFNGLPDLTPLTEQLQLDPDKETLLWLPTWRELSSVPAYAERMAELADDYNIIVKLHPLTQEEEPQIIDLLAPLPFTAVITSVIDNVYLFALADKVICDYGGTAFGAIYLDKPLLLLNLPDAQQDPLAGADSPDIMLRNDIVSLDAGSFHLITDVLNNEALWQQQQRRREQLRCYYFAPNYGHSAEAAAQAICQASEIIKQEGLTA